MKLTASPSLKSLSKKPKLIINLKKKNPTQTHPKKKMLENRF